MPGFAGALVRGGVRGALVAAAVAIWRIRVAARERSDWRQRALWKRVAAVTRDNPVGDLNLAHILEKEGQVEEAIGRLAESVRLSPEFSEARNNLGAALGRKGQCTPRQPRTSRKRCG